jgi:hypothetical protein
MTYYPITVCSMFRIAMFRYAVSVVAAPVLILWGALNYQHPLLGVFPANKTLPLIFFKGSLPTRPIFFVKIILLPSPRLPLSFPASLFHYFFISFYTTG